MRRKEKEITDPELISEIIRDCDVCRLGLAKDNTPYIVPVSFGYDGTAIYVHTARTGKKIDYIEANKAVCFEFEREVHPLPHPTDPCGWTFSFQTVIGYGTIHELETLDERAYGLDQIVAHYVAHEVAHEVAHYTAKPWELADKSVANLRVWKIAIEKVSGKQSNDRARS